MIGEDVISLYKKRIEVKIYHIKYSSLKKFIPIIFWYDESNETF